MMMNSISGRVPHLPPTLFNVAVILLMMTNPQPANATAIYSSLIEAEITFSAPRLFGPVLDISGFRTGSVEDQERSSGLPSFVTTRNEANYDVLTQTVSLALESEGAATYTSGPDDASAGSVNRLEASISLANFSERFGFFVDITVHAFFAVTGMTEFPREAAATISSLSFFADTRLGLDDLGEDDTIVKLEENTRLGNFDYVTSTFFLGVRETYSILVPANTSGARFGLFAQTGGAASSQSSASSSAPLTAFPIPPDLISATAVPLSEPNSSALILIVFASLYFMSRLRSWRK